MKVGIVMPSINLWAKYTKPAIDSVRTAMSEAFVKGAVSEFLLIDNGSTDETKDESAKISKENATIHVQRNEEMWGFQRSVNFGVKFFLDKGFDLVMVCNNDIVMHPQAVARLVERFSKGGVAMATCLDATGECDNKPENIFKLSDVEKEKCPESPHPNFSAFMVSRECWETVGEFDEIFFPAYYEDNDYHYRIQLAKLLAITYPPAMFFHYGSRTQNEAIGRPLTDSGNQHGQFIKKWGGNPTQEKYTLPYNDSAKSIKSVKQN